MTEHDNADEVTRLRAEVERAVRHLHVEARGLRKSTLLHRRNIPVADALDGIAYTLLAALDPASPATRPSPAPADDERTGTGAAPSEGHGEARGETCPTGCVEANHRGKEHRQWATDLRETPVTLGELEAAWRVGAGYLSRAEAAEAEAARYKDAFLRTNEACSAREEAIEALLRATEDGS